MTRVFHGPFIQRLIGHHAALAPECYSAVPKEHNAGAPRALDRAQNHFLFRHALFQGEATKLLKHLAESPEFLRATDRGVSDSRMDADLRAVVVTERPSRQNRRAWQVEA